MLFSSYKQGNFSCRLPSTSHDSKKTSMQTPKSNNLVFIFQTPTTQAICPCIFFFTILRPSNPQIRLKDHLHQISTAPIHLCGINTHHNTRFRHLIHIYIFYNQTTDVKIPCFRLSLRNGSCNNFLHRGKYPL